MNDFKSVYGNLLQSFIQYKRGLGYKFKTEEDKYLEIDRFFSRLGETSIGITRELAEKWAARRPNESDSNRYSRVHYLLKFAQYLNDIGHTSYIPKHPVSYKSTFTPYIFTRQEMDKILRASDGLGACNHKETCGDAVPAILRVLYGTGLRISEAVALTPCDVNLDECFLIVRQSKNGKERKLPFKESLANVCRKYRQKIELRSHGNDRFFVKANGRPCSERAIYEWFRKALRKAGIHHCGKGHGPRLHDVRHSFSVHSLAIMAGNGLDLYYSLPILSEYLGHQSLSATERYVRLTSEMYPGLLKDTRKTYAHVFPEAYEDEAY